MRFLSFIRRTSCALGIGVACFSLSGCDQPANGIYTQDDPGLKPQIIEINNDSATIGPPGNTKSYRVIYAEGKLRIEDSDGKLQANYRLLKSGLLCIETEEFFRKKVSP